MACPFFEPREVASTRQRQSVRLPLLDEYAGVCRASAAPARPAEATLAKGCNQGYPRSCENYPGGLVPAAMRYTVTGESDGMLAVTWVEEQTHAPVRWGTTRFDITQMRVVDTMPADAMPSTVIAAQLLAFCRSYLTRSTQQKEAVQPRQWVGPDRTGCDAERSSV
jgi:hypothetical protein